MAGRCYIANMCINENYSLMSLIASCIPGRLRLCDRALRNDARLDALGAAAARWRGVTDVEINPPAVAY